MGVITRSAARLLVLLALISNHALAQAGAPRQQTGSTLPASITNAEFWRIISQFSEPGGSFPSDNYTSNELQIGQVASDIIARGKTGGAYLGVGPEQNFTYITALKPDIVFIVDIRRQAIMQHLMYKAIFEMSNNRSEFIARLFSKPVQPMTPQDTAIRGIWSKYLPVAADSMLYRSNIAAIHNHLAKVRGFSLTSADSASIALVYDTFYRYGPFISYAARAGSPVVVSPNPSGATFLSLTLITDTTGVARSFLATDANYQFIRGLHSKNLFIPVVGDFGGPQALRRVGDYLREHRAIVAGYYTSNVEQYLFRPPLGGATPLWREYYNSVGFMPMDSSSVFIRPNGLRVTGPQVLQLVQGLTQSAAAPAGGQFSVGRYVEVRPPVPPTPPAVYQQPSLGSVTGTVTDSVSGNSVATATVQILGTASGIATDATGSYTIPNVTPGIYTVSLRRVGYQAANAIDIRVAAGAPTIVDFRAKVQPLVLTGVVSTGAGTFTVMSLGGAGGPPGVTLCPMIPFLAAYVDGRVQSYNDASACVK